MTRSTTTLLVLTVSAWSAGCTERPRAEECERRICGVGEVVGPDAGTSPGGDARVAPPVYDDAGNPIPGVDAAAPRIDAGTTPTTSGCHDCTAWQSACDGSDMATRTCTPRAGCTDLAPATTAVLPALDENFFRCRVQPILDRGCDQPACHGTEQNRPLRVYSRGSMRAAARFSGKDVAESIDPLTSVEWCRNYDSARSFAASTAADSELLTQALSPAAGGLSHVGIELWDAPSDPEYRTILDWLNGATLGSCDAGYNAHP